MYNREKFQALVKKGIGWRTQKEFAAQLGVSPARICRMLSDEDLPCPKVKTIEKLSEHMSNVSLPELMEACGYDVPKIEEVVQRFESDIYDFFGFGGEMPQVYDGIDKLQEKLKGFLRRKVLHIMVNEKTDEESIGRLKDIPGAETCSALQIDWEYDNYSCITSFLLYYSKTSGGKIILFATDLDETKEERTYITDTETAMAQRRLLMTIFGGETYLPVTYVGDGFLFTADKEAFTEFVFRHASAFTHSRENVSLYQRLVDGEEPDEFFAVGEFETLEDKLGPVIADIMKQETELEYEYFPKDIRIPEDERNCCIMARNHNEDIKYDEYEAGVSQLLYLKKCATELKLPAFGEVYYRTAVQKMPKRMHKTDGFYVVEKEEKTEN